MLVVVCDVQQQLHQLEVSQVAKSFATSKKQFVMVWHGMVW